MTIGEKHLCRWLARKGALSLSKESSICIIERRAVCSIIFALFSHMLGSVTGWKMSVICEKGWKCKENEEKN
jgi:hypothetical protein